MKLTSGRRKQQRQSRALDRLLALTFEAAQQGRPAEKPERTAEQWAARRDREAAILRERSGRRFE